MKKSLYYLIIFLIIILQVWVIALAATPQNKAADQLADYYNKMSARYQKLADQYSALEEKYRKRAKAENVRQTSDVKNPFVGSNAGLGLSINTGNNTNQEINAGFYISYVPSPLWETIWRTNYLYTASEEKQINNKLLSDLNSTRNLDDRNGVYGDVNYTRDLFAGYRYVATQSVGYNRILVESDTWKLNSQIGPGLMERDSNHISMAQVLPILYVALDSTVQLGSKVEWREYFNPIFSSKGTFYTLDNSLVTTVYRGFALSFDVLLNYDPQPPGSAYPLDTTTTVSLVYSV